MNTKTSLHSVWLYKAHFKKGLLLIVFSSLLHGCGLFGSSKGKVPTNSKQRPQQQNIKSQTLGNNLPNSNTALASSSKKATANNKLSASESLNQVLLASEEREALCAYVDKYHGMSADIKSVLKNKINTFTQEAFNATLDKSKSRTKDDIMHALISSDEISGEILPIMRKHAFAQKDSAKMGLRYHLGNHRPSLSPTIKNIVGKQLDNFTEQSFNELLDKTFILHKESRDNHFIIYNNAVDRVYDSIIHQLASKAQEQVARNEAWPSDEKGRQALLRCLNTDPLYTGKEPDIRQKIEEKINSYTKALFNRFLDSQNFLTGKFPAELRRLNNYKYIDFLKSEVVEKNDFSSLYRSVITHLGKGPMKEHIEQSWLELRRLQEERRALIARARAAVASAESFMNSSEADRNIPNIPTQDEVINALNEATQFTQDEKEAIKAYIHDESLLGVDEQTLNMSMFEIFVRKIYRRLEPTRRNVFGLLNFINDAIQNEKQKLENKKQEILAQLKTVIKETQSNREIGKIDSCVFCTEPFTDLGQDASGLLRCGHRIHVPCMAQHMAISLLEAETPTCPHCRGQVL